MARWLPRALVWLPLLTLMGVGIAMGDNLAEDPEELDLLIGISGVSAFAAIALTAALERATRSRAWMLGALAVCALPLAIPSTVILVNTGGWGEASSLQEMYVRIAAIGLPQKGYIFALLAVVSLLAGLALGLGGLEARDRSSIRPWSGVAAAALALPFVALVLFSSTGINPLSSAMRWVGCGWAILALALGAAVESERSRPLTTVLGIFPLVVALSLLANMEYLEAISAIMYAQVDPTDFPSGLLVGLEEMESAVGPRNRYGWLLSALPLVAFGLWPLRERARDVLVVFGFAGAIGFACLGIGAQLDHAAELAAFDARTIALDPAAIDEATISLATVEVQQPRHALEAPKRPKHNEGSRYLTVRLEPDSSAVLGPIIEAAQGRDADLAFVYDAENPTLDRAAALTLRVSPRSLPWLEAMRLNVAYGVLVSECMRYGSTEGTAFVYVREDWRHVPCLDANELTVAELHARMRAAGDYWSFALVMPRSHVTTSPR